MTTLDVTTSTSAAAPRRRVLRVGGTGGMTWAEVASVEWFGSFDVIYCEPVTGTEDLQEVFASRLREAISVLRRWSGRIVWIANEHFSRRVAEAIGCGEPVALPTLPPGETLTVLGAMDADATRPFFALRDLPISWSPFATWRSRDRTSEVIVGAMTTDERWVVTAPGIAAEEFVLPYEKLQRYLPVVWIVSLALAILLLGAREYSETAVRYEEGVSRIGSVDVRQLIAGHQVPGDSSADRMLHRILWDRSSALLSIADEIRFAKTPFQLWKASTKDQDGSLHFRLALLSGDLDAAYRIGATAAATQTVDENNWPELLTDTLWQRAVESLLELDFVHAEIYTAMYVRLSDLHVRRETNRENLETERNRTLARILLRELHSPRIYSLCKQPESARHFGMLLGSPFGEPLSATTPALTALRAANISTQCRGKAVESVDYAGLAELETIHASTDINDLSICRIAGTECEFLVHRSKLRQTNELQSAVAGSIAFASTCSYLSDDLVSVLTHAIVESKQKSLRIDIKSLDSALVCVDENSDYASFIADVGEELPCAVLTGGRGSLRSPIARQLLEGCGK
jgi:hypothetical protein